MRQALIVSLLATLIPVSACLTTDDADVATGTSERRTQDDPNDVDVAPQVLDPTSEAGGGKVKLCHVPPGNPENAHTINVSSSAVNAHLAHGDYLGRCNTVVTVCPPGEQWQCYTGPSQTDSVGVCERGIKTCLPDGSGYGPCVGEVTPGVELCDSLDNDCDGVVDDQCQCWPGLESSCYDGPPGTAGVGTCHAGLHTCNPDGQGHGECTGEVVPTDELCGDGLDTNCDGNVDEGCLCPPGEEWQCYTGPTDTDSVGACHRGIKTCNPDGMSYGACVGEATPQAEICGNAIDDDCDGVKDDGCNACAAGSTIACYGGPAGTAGVGTCAAGTQTCDGTGYGACTGDVQPVAEVCGDGLDNDCDGVSDDGCVCAPASTETCDAGLGVCAAGTRTCNPTGTAWGACVGSFSPTAEVCGDGLDNDCDGVSDEGCVCTPGAQASCYDGPAGTAGTGVCLAGVQTCDADGLGYGACAGAVGPSPELCGDGVDNDCDGVSDDGCVCVPGTAAACYAGPSAAAGVGVCAMGTQACNADGTAYEACLGSVLPDVETCGDGLDNDCDGLTDEGCIGDRVWRDTIRGTSTTTGIQNAGEVGLAGVTVQLRTASGALVAIQVTDLTGAYWFSNVPAGTYYLSVSAPPGFALVGANAGTDDNVDSDFDDEDLRTPNFSFAATGSITNIDAGFVGGGPV